MSFRVSPACRHPGWDGGILKVHSSLPLNDQTLETAIPKELEFSSPKDFLLRGGKRPIASAIEGAALPGDKISHSSDGLFNHLAERLELRQ